MKATSMLCFGRAWPHQSSGRIPWSDATIRCGSLLSRNASTVGATRLDYSAIDIKWQRRWAETPIGGRSSPSRWNGKKKKKSFILPMFPYPSGTLHLGHLRVYTISDVLARFRHMQGFNVIHPMGWDAFGLPAENAAIDRGVNPESWTLENIAKMKEQLSTMGGRWDWDREFKTCDPSFYVHTQRLFLLLHERGLAYQAESIVNFDPIDRTVLANEQVDANGFSWRSGAKVEKIRLKQWFLKITAFKEALLEDLELLGEEDRWPERVLSMQKNWLGRSSGAKIRFPVRVDTGSRLSSTTIEAFTTRPDTLYGVQYLALATNHPLVVELAKTSSTLQEFIDMTGDLPPESKLGYLLPGVEAVNPASYLRKAVSLPPLPVFVAPYVLGDYGEGAVMGVPGHDNRDSAFWKENQEGKPVKIVVQPQLETSKSSNGQDTTFIHKGILTAASGPYAGLMSAEAAEKIVLDLRQAGCYAEFAESWRLRDWLVSRQRYWGTPIPIVHCGSCGAVPVPLEQLPVRLPTLDGEKLRGRGGNPLQQVPEWVNTSCPSCGKPARRDTDTMDTFVDSSWYFMRFPDPHNANEPFSPQSADLNLPVDVYVGGVEHAILHLLYARFISKFLSTTFLWPSGGGPFNKGEPFKKLITQGMVHGKTYTDPSTGRFFNPEEIDLTDPSNPRIKATGEPPNVSYEKMSKSKYNGVDPATCISKYGADATRAHILFQAPVTEVLEWDEDRIVGIQRWFQRVWRISCDISTTDKASTMPSLSDMSPEEAALWAEVQSTIDSVTTALSRTYSLNTLVSDLIKLSNNISSAPTTLNPVILYQATRTLLHMMAPVAPAFAEECWERIHGSPDSDWDPTSSIFESPFPEPDGSLAALKSRKQSCAVQINGKLRFALETPQPPFSMIPDKDDAKAEKLAKDEQLREWIIGQILETDEGKNWLTERYDWQKARRIVVVRGGKTVNLVF